MISADTDPSFFSLPLPHASSLSSSVHVSSVLFLLLSSVPFCHTCFLFFCSFSCPFFCSFLLVTTRTLTSSSRRSASATRAPSWHCGRWVAAASTARRRRLTPSTPSWSRWWAFTTRRCLHLHHPTTTHTRRPPLLPTARGRAEEAGVHVPLHSRPRALSPTPATTPCSSAASRWVLSCPAHRTHPLATARPLCHPTAPTLECPAEASILRSRG